MKLQLSIFWAIMIMVFSSCHRHKEQLPQPKTSTSASTEVLKTAAATNPITPGLYIYSKGFKSYSNTFISNYLISNNYSHCILSLDNTKDLKARAITLARILNLKNIKMQILISNNDILLDTIKLQEYLDFNSDVTGAAGVHLDVEPQVFDDYQARKKEYMDQYVVMVKRASKYLRKKNLKLYLSVPMYFDVEYLKSIYPFADRVYIMAYENPDVNYIVKQVKDEMNIDKDKTYIALRTNDFATKVDLQNFMNQLSAALSTTHFAIHQLTGMIAYK